jgi:hypothetical protein
MEITFALIITIGFIIIYLVSRNLRGTLISPPTASTPLTVDEYKKVPCLLCGSRLRRGETIKSQEFKGDTQSIVHTMGCPYCWGPGATQPRTCPICGKRMGGDDYLVGIMMTVKGGKKHLRIKGCLTCHMRKGV